MKRSLYQKLRSCGLTFVFVLQMANMQATSLSDLTYNHEGQYYEIATIADLNILAEYVDNYKDCEGLTFKVTATELDFNGVTYIPIGGIYPFQGTFDGQGVIIKNLNIDLPDGYKTGLLKEIGINGIARNITFDESCTFKGYMYVGSVAGLNNGIIENCSNYGVVSGTHEVGGIVGTNDTNRAATIRNCTSGADVTGHSYVGGITGKNGRIAEECLVSGGTIKAEEGFVGAITGYSLNYVVNNFYYDNVKVVVEEQVYEGTTERGCGYRELKDITKNCGAVLAYDFSKRFNTLERRTFEIRDTTDMATLADIINCGFKSYGQTFKVSAAQLDFSSQTYKIIGDSLSKGFSGTFDGQGVIISHLELVDSFANNIGLFGTVESGIIRNVIIDQTCHVMGNSLVGGITGSSSCGLIEDCVNYGTVEGNSDVGGLIGTTSGWGYETSRVASSKNYGSIRGTTNVGGIVGRGYTKNQSIARNVEIADCLNQGEIQGETTVGGIMGSATCIFNNGYVDNCINQGTVAGSRRVGGIVGFSNHFKFSSCKNDGPITEYESISGSKEFGGIAGVLSSGCTIELCTNDNKILAPNSSNVGGIVGDADDCAIEQCDNSGHVVGYTYIGGIVGTNGIYTYVKNCFNNGSIEGKTDKRGYGGYCVGGIAGDGGDIGECINMGNVSGSFYVGGLIGYNSRTLRYSICDTCRITASNFETGYVGAIAGYNSSSSLKENYYYLETIVILGDKTFDGTTPRGVGDETDVNDVLDNNGAKLSMERIETGIAETSYGTLTSTNWYDLSGRKVTPPEGTRMPLQNGIYIVNGQKVVVKH